MLTEKECINALFDLKNQLEDVLAEESENIECENVLNQLIDEHFKDKKSLEERFKDYKGETIKDDPWGDELVD